jgi:hypothetical protein
MKGAFQRFLKEWTLPSVLLVRVGFPFVAGLYDVQPTVTSERGRQAATVRALNISIFSAVKTAIISAARYFSHRAVTIGICQALYSYATGNKTRLSFLESAAVEAESAERHTEFSIRQILRLVGIPEDWAGAATSLRKSTDEDIQRFRAEAQNTKGFLGCLSTNLQRHVLVSFCSSLHAFFYFWIATRLLRPDFKKEGELAVYLYDVNVEIIGIPSRKWQMVAAIGSNFSQAVGASFGVAFASLIAPSSSTNASNNIDSKKFEKTLQVTSLLLFLGEFVGGVFGMTLFRALYIKYRPNLEREAKVEERHHQAAMVELMSYTPGAKK